MSQIFLRMINMSISASYIVLAVLLLRLLFKKAPKWITVALWGIVAVRLVCPFSFESVLSLIPSAEVVSPSIMTDQTPTVHTGIPFVNTVVNPIIGESFAPAPGDSANPLQILVPVFSVVWVIGMLALLVYAVISYARVRRKVGTAVLYRDNVYQSENIASPFVLGLIKPRIYLPFHMCEQDMPHVVAHEQAHVRRRDYLWKPLGFLLLTLHWFNPLMWFGYVLLCRDIELACDEKVIRALDRDARADYSEALLRCSINRRMIAACPLAFGEVGVKERVRSVLSYKKPAFWIILASLVACVVVAVCFLTDPVRENRGETDPEKLDDTQISLMDKYPEYFGLDASGGLDVYVWQLAKDHYSFGLLSHSVFGRNWLSDELMNLRGVDVDTMRAILSTYDIGEDKIYIIPWQNPISSYLGEWQIVKEGEDIEEKRDAYVERIREMLFGAEQENEEDPNIEETIDTEQTVQYETIAIIYPNEDGHIFYEPHYCETFFVEDDTQSGGFYYHRFYKKCSECGEVLESKDIYRCQINHSKCQGDCFEHSGGSVQKQFNDIMLIFAEPSLSCVISEVPTVTIQGDELYDAESEKLLGAVSETVLTDGTFAQLATSYAGHYGEIAEELQQSNEVIYEVIPVDSDGVDLYYVLRQKDGTTVLVYGHYANGEKTDFIRWIFRIGK